MNYNFSTTVTLLKNLLFAQILLHLFYYLNIWDPAPIRTNTEFCALARICLSAPHTSSLDRKKIFCACSVQDKDNGINHHRSIQTGMWSPLPLCTVNFFFSMLILNLYRETQETYPENPPFHFP